MLRTLLITAALVASPAATSLAQARIELHALEVIVEFGSQVGRSEFAESKRGEAREFEVVPGLEMRCRSIEVVEGNLTSGEVQLLYGPGRRHGYGLRADVEDDYIQASFMAFRTRGSNRYISQVMSLSTDDTLRRPVPQRTGHSIGGGALHEVFCIVDVDQPAWPRPHRGDDPKSFLTTALKRFERNPSTSKAHFVLALLRYVPLSELGPSWASRAELLFDELENQAVADDMVTVRRGRRFITGASLVEQARMVNVPWTLEEDRDGNTRRGVDWYSYPAYRFIAESDRHEADARVVALERSLSYDGNVRFHDHWIDMIESGQLRIDEPQRTRLLQSLRAEVNGRRPGPLMLLVLGGMGGLVIALFTLRFVARRAMFA